MERNLFKYIVGHSLPSQIRLVLLTAISFPFLYLSLDLPKIIINEAIGGGTEFPTEFAFGIALDQIDYLLVLCGTFLALVCINGGFKYFINVYAGIVGERMLRRLRYTLFRRLMRFPIPHFRRVGQGEVVTTVVAETEPLAGFIGDSIKLPVFQGGTLVTIVVFMFVQNWVLGLAAVALYPVQGFLIPKLQRRLSALKRELVHEKRRLSERIGEVAGSIQEVHAHDTSEYEGAMFSSKIGDLYWIRLDIYKRKFLIKFLNNFLAQVTPFFFYSIGGYLIITGEGDLTLGALVAVLAAYKDLSAPWKELLNYYQLMDDARIKYDLLYDMFNPPGVMDERMQSEEPDPIPTLSGEIIASRLDVREEADGAPAGGISFRSPLPRRIAIVGSGGSAAGRLTMVLARLLEPLAGEVNIGGHDLATLPETVAGRRLAYVGQDPRLRAGSLLDNLVYPLKHRPTNTPVIEPSREREHRRALVEARASGNSEFDAQADWVDYASAGASDSESLTSQAIQALTVADLDSDVYELGLRGRIDPEARADLASRIMEARFELRERLKEPEYAELVEPFDQNAYNTNMTVAENLLFGTPTDASFDFEQLSLDDMSKDGAQYVRKVLHETELMRDFVVMGRQLAELMVDLFADVAPDSELFEQFSFITADALPEFAKVLGRTSEDSLDDITDEDRWLLLSLPFQLTPARHRLGLIDEPMQARLLRARGLFSEGFGAGAPPVDFFDAERYNAYGSIQDNILFGRLAYGRARSASVVGSLIREVVERQDLLQAILEEGLNFQVGIGGGRLSTAQRQKLAISRAYLKGPDILFLDDATAPLDGAAHERIKQQLLESNAERSLIWVVPHAKVARAFDTILVLDGDRIVEQGTFDELSAPGTTFSELLEAD